MKETRRAEAKSGAGDLIRLLSRPGREAAQGPGNLILPRSQPTPPVAASV